MRVITQNIYFLLNEAQIRHENGILGLSLLEHFWLSQCQFLVRQMPWSAIRAVAELLSHCHYAQQIRIV